MAWSRVNFTLLDTFVFVKFFSKATGKMGIVMFVIICSKNSWSVGVGDKSISVDFLCVCVCVCVPKYMSH